MGAGIIEAIFAVTPMETMKTKMIEKNLGLVDGFKYIIQTGGVRGLYQVLYRSLVHRARLISNILLLGTVGNNNEAGIKSGLVFYIPFTFFTMCANYVSRDYDSCSSISTRTS